MQDIKSLLAAGVDFVPAVVGYLITADQVLLGERKVVSNGLGQNLIAGIGGKVEAGESNYQALVRELKEEIEINVVSAKYVGRVRFLFPQKPKWQQDVAIYLVNEWNNEPAETEPIKPIWCQKNNLPLNEMWPDNALWLPDVLSGKTVDAVYLYDESGKIIETLLQV